MNTNPKNLLLFLLLSFNFCLADPFVTVSGTDVYDVLPTGSMAPGITERNWVLVKKLPFKDIVADFEGDVILIQLPKPVSVGPFTASTMLHRAIRKSSGGSVIIVKGDNNSIEDSILVTEDMYLGTVVGVIRKPERETQ